MSNPIRIALPSLLAACAVSFLACGPAAAPPALRGEVGVFLRIEGNPLPAEREALARVVASAGMRSQGGDRPTRFEVVDRLRAQVIVEVATELRSRTEPEGGVVIARELRDDGRVYLGITTDGLVKAGLALDRELRRLSEPAVVDSMRAEGRPTEPTQVTSMRAESAPDREGRGCHHGACFE
jgi:hypothetical protein